MKYLAITAAALVAATSTAFANSVISDTASPATKIVEGHGNPGDTASSMSAPHISFRVLKNGKVERTNSRFGTVAIIDPMADRQKTSNGR